MSGAKGSGVDDKPRETPSAKVSEGRLPKASAVQPRAPEAGAQAKPAEPKHSEAVRLDLPVVPRDIDTEPQTQGARQSRNIKIEDKPDESWPPADALAKSRAGPESWRPPPDQAGRIYVRTFQARGVLGSVLVLLGFLIVLGVTIGLFTLVIGIGAAVAAGSALATIFGIGAVRVRRALRARGDDKGGPSLPGG